MKYAMVFFVALFSILTSAESPAQLAPKIEWQKSLGGSNIDFAYSIQQTSDGGYIMAGSSASTDGDVTGNHGGDDYWIVKLGSSGVIQWQKSLGGSNYDDASTIQQTSDGGYVVAGYSNSIDGDVTGNHGSNDYWIVKLNSTGVLQWQKSFGGSGDDRANSIQQTSDGGYIVAGYSLSNDGDVTGSHGDVDYWMVKLDASGTIQWQKSLGGSRADEANSIQQTSDGGYVVAGYSNSIDGDVTGNHGGIDYWIVKLNSTGVLQWQKSLGGSGDEVANSIQQTSDGGYIVGGYSYSSDGDVTGNHGNSDYWVVKLGSSGNLEWQKSLGGSTVDDAYFIQQKSDGGYIVTGLSYSSDGDVTGNHGQDDYWVVKLGSSGTLEWQKSLGGSYDDVAGSIQQTLDGGYIVAGSSPSIDGDVTGTHGNWDYWIVKLAPPTPAGTHPATREVLFETFTNWNSYWCAPFDSQMVHFMQGVGRTAQVINYHTTSYGYNDPMFLFDSTNQLARSHYYATPDSVTPYVAADGIMHTSGYDATNGESRFQSYVDTRMEFETPLKLYVWLAGPSNLATGEVHVAASSTAPLHGNYKLRVAIVQSVVDSTPGGTNGETSWENVVREMVPDANGTSFGIDSGQVRLFNLTYDKWRLPTSWFAVAWVQNDDTHEVINSANSTVGPYMSSSVTTLEDSLGPCSGTRLDTIFVSNTTDSVLSMMDLVVDSVAIAGQGKADFTLVSPPVPWWIYPSDSLAVIVRYHPAQSISRSAQLQIYSNDPRPGRNPWNIALSGHKDSADIQITSSVLDFGRDTVFQQRTIADSLINTGTVKVTVDSITRDFGDNVFDANVRTVVTPGNKYRFLVTFIPTDTVPYQATFTVHTSPCGFGHSFSVTGKGLPTTKHVDSLTINTHTLAFGTLLDCGAGKLDTLHLANAGNEDLNVTCSIIGNDASDFAFISPSAFQFLLAAGAPADVIVRCIPSALGARTASLIVQTDKISIPNDTIALAAFKDTADITLPISPQSFGDVHVSANACMLVPVNATGGVLDTIVRVTSTDSIAFSFSTPLPFVVRAGAVDSLSICFSPPDTGTRQARFTLHTAPCDHARYFTATGHGSRGVLTLSSSTLDFGALDLCVTKTDTVKVRNAGTTSQQVSVAITGANKVDFALVSANAFALAPGESRDMIVICRAKTVGSRTANLTITATDTSVGTLIALLKARQLASPLEASTPAITFNTIDVGAHVDTTIAVYNTGAAPFRVGSVAGDSGFIVSAVGNLPRTLFPGDTVFMKIRFQPTAAALYSSNASVQVDSPCATALQVTVVGVGRGKGGGACAATATVSISSNTAEANVGGAVVLPLFVTSSQNLDSCRITQFTWRVQYHRSILIPDILQPGAVIDSSYDVGADHILVVNGARSSGHDLLAELHFIAALGDTDATLLHSDFQWTNLPFNVTAVTASVPDVNFKIANVCIQGGARYFIAGPSPTLAQNRPNPFVDQTTFEFDVAEKGRARLLVHDMLGRECGTVLDEELTPGHYVREFSARVLPAGMYVYTLRTATSVIRREMVVGR